MSESVVITENDTIVMSLFDWCASGQHDRCRRIFRRYVINQKNKIENLDEVIKCSCKNRTCDCYTRPADRPVKKATRKRKRKS